MTSWMTKFYLVLEALHLCESLEDFGGDRCGHHADPPGVGRVWVRLPPVKQHPPAQQSAQLIACKYPPRATYSKQNENEPRG